MRKFNSLPKFDVLTEISRFSSCDIDANLDTNLNCNYYTVDDFHKLQFEKNFNLFHSNVNGIESHFEVLHKFVSNCPSKFDVINIIETTQKIDDFV